MQKIKSIPELSLLMIRGSIEVQACVSEIGVVGYFISEGDKIIKNEASGYTVRTKVKYVKYMFSNTNKMK